MAAMGTFQISEAFGNLEQRAEGKPTTTNDPSSSSSHPHSAYSRAYFSPRILLVFTLAISVPTIYIFLYVGALWNPVGRLHNVVVHLVNLDAGVNRTQLALSYGLNATGNLTLYTLLPSDNIGLSLADELLLSPATSDLFAWRYFDASNSTLQSLPDVEEEVRRGDATQWMTVVIPANYTSAYLSQALNVYNLSQLNDDFYALATADLLPSPLSGAYTNAIYEVWDQGRNFGTNSFITSAMTSALNALSSAAALAIYRNIATLPVGSSYLKTSFLLTPVPVVSVNVHPVPYYGMKYLSALVLWVGATITLTVVVKWSNGVEEKFFRSGQYSEGLTSGFVLSLRILMLAGVTLIQAACCMAVIPALGGGSSLAYSKGALFVWLWYCAFVYIVVLGSLLALVGPDVFQLPATLWLILQLTSSGAFLDQVLQPGFYQIGRAFPLYYTVRANRTILFGSYYHFEEDALVLFGWLIWGLLVVMVAGSRRVDKRWETLRHNELVHLLRDTVGFSAAAPHTATKAAPDLPSDISASQQQRQLPTAAPSVKQLNVADEEKAVDGVQVSPPQPLQMPPTVVTDGS